MLVTAGKSSHYLMNKSRFQIKALTDSDYSIDFGAKDLSVTNDGPWVFSHGKAVGRVSGGNLDTISSMDFSDTGIKEDDILFLEEVAPYYSFKTEASDVYNKIKKIISNMPRIKALIIGKSKTPIAFDPENDIFGSRCFFTSFKMSQLRHDCSRNNRVLPRVRFFSNGKTK